jgi:hypothetical protein
VGGTIGNADKSIVGLEIPCTWQLKGRDLHMVAKYRGTRVEQVWVPAD